ncbi:unnamed protein product [Clonostachys rosea f. rosea IK726]|uniref:Uncharacterized protein n=1 Tax=Clonostachys rosea f. rosea IK726 TaxID=1349383 RepID=A0ACA9U9U0_BIOOC|nr:unnamed protein product [Clonostachys rosea f. rosea IK726]
MEGSIRWWSRDHRAHHRYTDTVKDPYSVRKGLLYSHLGWMVFKQNPKNTGRTDITDLNEDPVVVWQHRNFIKCVLFMALIFLPLSAVFSGTIGWVDSSTPLFSVLLTTATHPVTTSSRLVTLGEGYHNFHHEFPSDYRNAIEWWHSANEIEKGRVQQLQKKLDQKRATLNWGTPLEQLPVIGWDDFVEEAKNGKALVAIAGVIHDVTDFIKDHPGGRALIKSAIGKDATAIFNGGVYYHSNAAHNLLSTMRYGVLRGGCEVEIWKRAQFENKDVTYVNDSAGQRIIRAGNQVTKVTQPIGSADAA